MSQKPLCIYHGNCDDGFAAAWVVRKALGPANVEFYPGVYQKEPPPHDGRDIILVDFSYKRPVLDAMAQRAHSVLILDHHKTAQEDLADLKLALPWDTWRNAAMVSGDPPLSRHLRMSALFDQSRSGAGIAWDYFFPAVTRPTFIDLVEDRDLWRKKLPKGDEFTIALRSYPQDFEVWDKLVPNPFGLMVEGETIQRYYRLRVEELKRSAYKAVLMPRSRAAEFDPKKAAETPTPSPSPARCLISNAPYFAASEVAGELAQRDGANFGACYFEVEQGRWQYSLRSRNDFDVSAIARLFGGGGHKNAAGFSTDYIAHTPI